MGFFLGAKSRFSNRTVLTFSGPFLFFIFFPVLPFFLRSGRGRKGSFHNRKKNKKKKKKSFFPFFFFFLLLLLLLLLLLFQVEKKMSALKFEVTFGFNTADGDDQKAFDEFASDWEKEPFCPSIKITFDRFVPPSASLVKRIAKWFEKNGNPIYKVKLYNLRMNDDFLCLFEELRHLHLTQLSLSFKRNHTWSISERFMGALAQACTGPYLKSLTIAGAAFPLNSRILLKADNDYHGSLLRKLRLDYSTIDSVDLFACLDGNSDIEELRVKQCDLSLKHMKAFSRSHCPNLKFLDLSGNLLGEVGSAMLAALINNLPSLESLDLTDSNIAELENESEHAAFKTALETHTKLERLVLTRTTSNLAMCAIQSLFVNRSIKHFVDESSWENRAACFLQVLRSGNSTLETVKHREHWKRRADTDAIEDETDDWLAYNRAMKVYAKEMRALMYCWEIAGSKVEVLPIDLLKNFPKPSPPTQLVPVELADSFEFEEYGRGLPRRLPKHSRLF
jgi:hypothetical protein